MDDNGTGKVSYKPHHIRMDHLPLDELAEVRRIDDIVKDVRAGNPPRFYSAKEKLKQPSKFSQASLKNLRMVDRLVA